MGGKYRLLENEACDDEDMILPTTQSSASWLPFTCRQRTRTSPKSQRVCACIITLGSALLYSFAIWGFINVLQQLLLSYHSHHTAVSNNRPQLDGCDCGESVAEAMSLGCKFDALSMAWLPDHCRDDELTAEFDTTGKGPNGTWVYYADTARTIELNVVQVAAMGDDPAARAHMDKDWHQIHCFYYWLKLHRTRETGKIIEPRSDTEGHIRHCGMVFREPGYGTISGVALNTNEAVEE